MYRIQQGRIYVANECSSFTMTKFIYLKWKGQTLENLSFLLRKQTKFRVWHNPMPILQFLNTLLVVSRNLLNMPLTYGMVTDIIM